MFKKIASTFGTKVITSIINLIIVVIISRTMGTEGKGMASLVVTSIALVMMFCNVLGGATLVYLVPRHNFFQLFFLSYIWTLLICATIYGAIVCLLPESLFIVRTYAPDIFMLSLLSSFLSINLMLLLGKERILSNNLVSLLQSLLNLGILAFLVYGINHRDIGSYIQTLYITLGVCSILSFLLLLRHFNSFSFKEFNSLTTACFKLGLANQLGHILQFVSLRLSYYILERVSGSDAVGVYSNGVSIVESIWLITNSIAVVQYARIANTNDLDYSKQLTLRLTRFSTILCFTAIVPMLLLPSSFFVWLFGEGFAPVSKVILLLSPGILFYNTGLIIGHYFSGTGKYYINSIGNLAGLLVTAIGSFLFIHKYSISYAAIIASAAYGVMSLYVLLCFMKEAELRLTQLIPKYEDIRFVISELKKIISNKGNPS